MMELLEDLFMHVSTYPVAEGAFKASKTGVSTEILAPYDKRSK